MNRTQIIGMVHLPPLPDSPRFEGSLDSLYRRALQDAAALKAGGADAILIENFGDTPFRKGEVSPVVVAAMSSVATQIREKTQLPIGINVLRNDSISAMGVAVAVGAEFIRVNILTGARLTDQGIIEGQAAELLRLRRVWAGQNVKICADIDVKHSSPLADRSLEQEVEETLDRAGADILIVSGSGTGKATPLEKLKAIKLASRGGSVWVGSGVNAENVRDYLPYADGFIVGTSIKQRGEVAAPVDEGRVKAFANAVRAQ